MKTPDRPHVQFSLSHPSYDLHRKGPMDQARHQEKVRQAIRDNLPEVISEEAIITSDGQKIVKIPIRGVDNPVFRWDHRKMRHAGQGTGASQTGDVIGQDPGQSQAPGRGKRAGELPGIDYYEAEFTIDELAVLVFEDLSLPNLKQKTAESVEVETIRFKDIRKTGILSNLDKRRTILENMRRNAVEQRRPIFEGITTDDLRFRTWSPEFKRESNAVVIAMRDVSGSMGEFEKYITRSFYFWMIRFLRTKYQQVEIVFITHHTEAKEVDEQAFFGLGESGGTRVSSAYQLALDVIKERYPPERFNIYPYHFSDGDNYGDSDNKLCVDLVRQHLQVCNAFGYAEIHAYDGSAGKLLNAFEPLKDDPAFTTVVIKDKKDVHPALKKFFGSERQSPTAVTAAKRRRPV